MTVSTVARALVVAALSMSAVAFSASGTDLRLESVKRTADAVENRLASLEREYSHRRGLIGAHAAEVRFENAVFDYLVGDYDEAATQFYTLVASEALVDKSLAQDAEWYLAECLLEDRNTVTSVEAYQRIIDQGQAHPFFGDAVRRQLEAFGYLKDPDGFFRVYNRYIVTAIVPTTDKVLYSMAKSFYHQGDWTRAKSLFADVSGESQMFTRARYFMGAILVAEGQLEAAVPQFERVTQYMPPMTADGYHGVGGIEEFASRRAMEGEVVELARLALGRVYYELGDFGKSQHHYRTVATESEQFADQLYELVWVYLKQDLWLDAINQIEIFLIAYPEHRYAFQLQLLLGHLHMRREAYERALVSYEKVVDVYGPIQSHLDAIQSSRTRPDDFFGALVESEKIEDVDPEIPAFAVSLLAEDKHVGRAVTIRRELNRQESDIEVSRNLIDQIAPVLQQGTQGIGTFRAGRNQIGGVRNDSLKLRVDLVDAELSMQEDAEIESIRRQVTELRRRLDVLVGRLSEIRGEENDQAGKLGAYAGQVDAVQDLASRSRQLAAQQIAQLESLKARLNDNASDLSPAEVADIRGAIADLERGLRGDLGGLDAAASPDTKRRVMRTVGDTASTEAQRGLVGDDLAALKAEVQGLRPQLRVDGANFSRLDEHWTRAVRVERRALSVMGKLERAEQTELRLMRRQLSEHMDAMIGLTSEHSSTSGTAAVLSSEVTRAGIGRVEDEFNETVMGADRGIVDVYWTRKATVSDEIERLGEERGLRSRELDERFQTIRQRMGQIEGGG